MKAKSLLIVICLLMSLSTTIFADSGNVATILLLRGKVSAKLPDGKIIGLKAEQTLPEGAELITSEKSFVKLVFIDKSTINLGPSSSMIIQAFPKKEAGIIKLIQGQIRAEVTKNYMEMDDKSKSKLYIQTKTSAMGIRGTDFQVNYNPANGNSSLIVFEGKVVMNHIDRASQNDVFAQKKLEMLVSSNTAVLVKQGQISAVNLNISDRALVPTKLAPKQLDALKENRTGLDVEPSASSSKKEFRDLVPPGVDGAAFLNVSPEAQKLEVAEAKSFFNEKTHEYKPAAGAIIDLKTVNIIAPDADAKFDPRTKTFVVSENFGKIDEKSGQFRAPKGYELSNEGQYQAAGVMDQKKLAESKDETRMVDSKNPIKREDGKVEARPDGVPVVKSVLQDSTVNSVDALAPKNRVPVEQAPMVQGPVGKVPMDQAPKVQSPVNQVPLATLAPAATIKVEPSTTIAPAPIRAAPLPVIAPPTIKVESSTTIAPAPIRSGPIPVIAPPTIKVESSTTIAPPPPIRVAPLPLYPPKVIAPVAPLPLYPPKVIAPVGTVAPLPLDPPKVIAPVAPVIAPIAPVIAPIAPIQTTPILPIDSTTTVIK